MRTIFAWPVIVALLCVHQPGAYAQDRDMASAQVVGSGAPATCTETALSAAIAAGGLIRFDCGGPHTFVLTSLKRVDKLVHIDGGGLITFTVDGPDLLSGSAGERGSGAPNLRLFDVDLNATLTIENSTLAGARSSGSDGGAIANDGALFVNNVRFIDNRTDGEHRGGAIFSAGPLHITRSYFERNGATWGGAIAAERLRAQVIITDSVFLSGTSSSKSEINGGAIYIGARASLDVRGGLFAGNSAISGGAVYIGMDGRATLGPSPQTNAPVMLANNHAEFGGGAIWNNGALTLSGARITANSVFTGSSVFGYGGGVANWLGVLTMTNTLLRDNVANWGGGLFTGYAEAKGQAQNTVAQPAPALAHADLSQVNITNNSAVTGGGVFAANWSPDPGRITLAAADTIIRDNIASDAGGGLYVANARATLARSALVFNEALRGGGVHHEGQASSTLQISDSTISHNTLARSGVQGGGIYNAALVELSNVTLTDNSNGLFSSAGAITMTGAVLENPGFLNCDMGIYTQLSATFSFGTDTSCGAALPKSGDSAGLGGLHEDARGQLAQIPLPGSPLIDAGGPDCAWLDQRMALRADRCDIGAIEQDGLHARVRLAWVTR